MDSKSEVLFKTTSLKCRFCTKEGDDLESFTTILKGEILGPERVLLYHPGKNRLRPNTLKGVYAMVECPNLGCSRILMFDHFWNSPGLRGLLAKRNGANIEQELSGLGIPELTGPISDETIHINSLVEYGTLACWFCYDKNNPPNNIITLTYQFQFPHRLAELYWICLKIECPDKQCSQTYPAEKDTIEGLVVAFNESKIMKLFGFTPDPPKERIPEPEPQEEEQTDSDLPPKLRLLIKIAKELNDPKILELNLKANMIIPKLRALYGVPISLDPEAFEDESETASEGSDSIEFAEGLGELLKQDNSRDSP